MMLYCFPRYVSCRVGLLSSILSHYKLLKIFARNLHMLLRIDYIFKCIIHLKCTLLMEDIISWHVGGQFLRPTLYWQYFSYCKQKTTAKYEKNWKIWTVNKVLLADERWQTLTCSFQQDVAFGNSEEIPSTASVYAVDPRLVCLSYIHLTTTRINPRHPGIDF